MVVFLMCCAALWMAAPAAAHPSADTSQAYRVYTSGGAPATLDSIVAAMAQRDVVLIGEVHNDPTAHALQRKLLERAFQRYGAASDSAEGRPIALSLEMFERDVQPIVDEYLRGWITERHFLQSSRPWSNYRTDYRPLVEFAKAHDLPVLAANAPRRYVNRVSREGAASLADLPTSAKQWLPPLPIAEASPAYRAKWIGRMQAAMSPADSTQARHPAPTDTSDTTAHGAGQTSPHGHAMMANMLQAQSLWDAAMAHTLAQYLIRQPDGLALHVVGQFHISEGTGIPEHLARYRPGTQTLNIVIEPADDIGAFDTEAHRGLGDFVILTDAGRVPSTSGRGSF